jgi:hypothetical protein
MDCTVVLVNAEETLEAALEGVDQDPSNAVNAQGYYAITM